MHMNIIMIPNDKGATLAEKTNEVGKNVFVRIDENPYEKVNRFPEENNSDSSDIGKSDKPFPVEIIYVEGLQLYNIRHFIVLKRSFSFQIKLRPYHDLFCCLSFSMTNTTQPASRT